MTVNTNTHVYNMLAQRASLQRTVKQAQAGIAELTRAIEAADAASNAEKLAQAKALAAEARAKEEAKADFKVRVEARLKRLADIGNSGRISYPPFCTTPRNKAAYRKQLERAARLAKGTVRLDK